MMFIWSSAVWALLLALAGQWTQSVLGTTIKEGLGGHSNLSKFLELVRKDAFAKFIMESKTCTVFAPSNEAINMYADDQSKLVVYHTTLRPVVKGQFPVLQASVDGRAPNMYLSKAPEYFDMDGKAHGEEFYMNDAKIIEQKHYHSAGGKQILYTVDRVSTPYQAGDGEHVPTAAELLDRPGTYSALGGGFDLGFFRDKVKGKKEAKELFENSGMNTYFVPKTVSSGLRGQVDDKVVLGHVIPGKALFIRPMANGTYQTAAFNKDIKVELKMTSRTMPAGPTHFVQSTTIFTNGRHHTGIVVVKVLQANVPVSNGVVHFIEKPLMLIDMTVWDFIGTIEKGGALSQFNSKIAAFKDIQAAIEKSSVKTVFAPSNEAFLKIERHLEGRNYTQEMRKILLLHVLPGVAVSSEKAKTLNHATSLDNESKLYFSVMMKDDRRCMSVEGGGVNATVIQGDIGATNGIVHIIDKVLGVPFLTIADKMSKDPSMESTYRVASAGNRYGKKWTDQLRNADRKFTMFVPSESAWHNLSYTHPSEHKQLLQGMYPHLADKILDRHLLTDHVLYMDDLRNASVSKIETVRGTLTITKHQPLSLIWEGIIIKIVRPDVQAINGVIHIIDKVIMLPRDLATSPAVASTSTVFALLLPVLSILLLRR